MSLGGLGDDYSACAGDPLHLAICNSTDAGVVYTAAAGNNGWDWGAPPPDVPAWFPEVLTVTAMADSDGQPGGTGGAPSCRPAEVDDRRASFSNFSHDADDDRHAVAAPGVCIRSTWPGGGYATLSGTSMAAPHVAGLVALCMGEGGAAGPCTGLAPADVIQRIRADAQARATAANGFQGDPLQPLGRYFGHLASATATTGMALRAPDPPPASPACGGNARAAGTHLHHQADRAPSPARGNSSHPRREAPPRGDHSSPRAQAAHLPLNGR